MLFALASPRLGTGAKPFLEGHGILSKLRNAFDVKISTRRLATGKYFRVDAITQPVERLTVDHLQPGVQCVLIGGEPTPPDRQVSDRIVEWQKSNSMQDVVFFSCLGTLSMAQMLLFTYVLVNHELPPTDAVNVPISESLG